MSIDIYVSGHIPPDSKYRTMKNIWTLCEQNDIPIPEKVQKFFDYQTPSEKDNIGMEADISSACEEFSIDYMKGYIIDLKKLPESVQVIKVYIS